MLVDLKGIFRATGMVMTIEEEVSVNSRALIAIAERLEDLCKLLERAQRPDGTLKREKPL